MQGDSFCTNLDRPMAGRRDTLPAEPAVCGYGAMNPQVILSTCRTYVYFALFSNEARGGFTGTRYRRSRPFAGTAPLIRMQFAQRRRVDSFWANLDRANGGFAEKYFLIPTRIACASLSWYLSSLSFFSSSGLVRKAVSTRMDGMSGALSTAKPACSTCDLCRSLTPPISPRTALASFRLSLMVAVWARSNS